MTLPGFDTSLGTLTAVGFTLTGGASADVVVANNSSTPGAGGRLDASWTFSASARVGSTLVASMSTSPSTTRYPALPAYFSNTYLLQVSGSAAATPLDLQPFTQGLGVDVMVSVSDINLSFVPSPISCCTGGVLGGSPRPTWVTVGVTYTYDTLVPEPASAAVLGAAILALGMRRRRG